MLVVGRCGRVCHDIIISQKDYPVTGNKFANKVVGVGKRDSCCVLCRGNHEGCVASVASLQCRTCTHQDM
jgi:hypothetical protein